MSLTIGQVLHTWSCRSETHSIFDREQLPRNPYVEGAILGSLGLQIFPLVFPPPAQPAPTRHPRPGGLGRSDEYGDASAGD